MKKGEREGLMHERKGRVEGGREGGGRRGMEDVEEWRMGLGMEEGRGLRGGGRRA